MHLKKVTLLKDTYPTTDDYPFNLELFHKTRDIDLHNPVTFFIGDNGTGKSTLLEALARKCGIHIWNGFEKTRYRYNPYEKRLYEFIDIQWTADKVKGSFFASDIFKSFSKSLDEWASMDPGVLKYFGGDSLMEKSHGQSLMAFFMSRFKIKGLYLLDEPETALSPGSQISLLSLLKEMTLAGHAQFIIVTHSPILLAFPEAKIYSFDKAPVEEIGYEDTEYYKVYKAFMDDREKFL